MSRKFSIFSKMFFEEMLKEIEEYIMINGETNPYIFMSEDTMQKMLVANDWALKSMRTSHNKYNATLYGYKVFINNDLNLGIVEIR